MPDEPQNPSSEENSTPPSPHPFDSAQDLTEKPTELIEPEGSSEPERPASENTAHSEPSNAPPEALESSPNDFSVKSNDIPPSIRTLDVRKQGKNFNVIIPPHVRLCGTQNHLCYFSSGGGGFRHGRGAHDRHYVHQGRQE